jgi:hypothetical protein
MKNNTRTLDFPIVPSLTPDHLSLVDGGKAEGEPTDQSFTDDEINRLPANLQDVKDPYYVQTASLARKWLNENPADEGDSQSE